MSYTFEIGDQDNRQPGRGAADFLIHTHGITVAWRVNEAQPRTLATTAAATSAMKSQATYNNGGTAGISGSSPTSGR